MDSSVEIISKEMIKPSSPTPDHLKIFKLSYLDQFAPPIYVPFIFFYEADKARGLITSNHAQISLTLKKSLSETLTTFYPLAGRVVRGYAVDCNDAGVEFTDARVCSQLTESVQEADVEQLKKLLSLDPAVAGSPGERTLVLVQLNFFDCGGIAVSICVSHQVADMASTMNFFAAWAATCGGERKTSQLGIQLGGFLPAQETPGPKTWETQPPNQNLKTKMVVFTKEKLGALKRAAVSSTESTVSDPSRVELVSAFIWQNLSKFFKSNPEKGPFAAFHAVNMRARVGQDQKILESVFGNFIMPAFVFPGSSSDEEFHESVRKFRSSIRSINFDILSDTESRDRMANDILSLFANGVELFPLTSWCRFPVYEVDFGWGEPIWVCTPRGGMKNGILLLDSKTGEDVQVWLLNLDPNILEILETQIKQI